MKNSLFVLLFATLLVSAIALAYKAARSVFPGLSGSPKAPSITITPPNIPGVRNISSAVLSFNQQSGTWQGAQKATGVNIAGADIYSFLFDPTDARRLLAATSYGFFVHNQDENIWTQLGVDTLPSGTTITAVAVNAQNPSIIFAASVVDQQTSLLWRSSDKGKTFQNVYSGLSRGGVINSLAVDFSDPRNVFALTSTGSLLQSNDMGFSWKVAHTFQGVEVRGLVMDTNNSSNLYVYSSGPNGFFQSIDKGKTWRDGSSALASFSRQAQQVNGLRVARGNSSLLYLATDYGILRSRDKGVKFTLIPFLITAGAAPISDFQIGASNNDLFALVDSQIYVSKDAGITWQARNIPAQETVNILAVNPFNSNIIFIGTKH
ncbi:MAG: hypothetical protein HYV65_02775 [Candidatus Spechtbacteria bacterium]|nr:hypothetical protein [Candidatus Spechtbacteria bacterium]